MNEKNLWSLIRRFKIVKMAGSILPNNLESNKIPFNIPADFFFVEMDKPVPKFM